MPELERVPVLELVSSSSAGMPQSEAAITLDRSDARAAHQQSID